MKGSLIVCFFLNLYLLFYVIKRKKVGRFQTSESLNTSLIFLYFLQK